MKKETQDRRGAPEVRGMGSQHWECWQSCEVGVRAGGRGVIRPSTQAVRAPSPRAVAAAPPPCPVVSILTEDARFGCVVGELPAFSSVSYLPSTPKTWSRCHLHLLSDV